MERTFVNLKRLNKKRSFYTENGDLQLLIKTLKAIKHAENEYKIENLKKDFAHQVKCHIDLDKFDIRKNDPAPMKIILS